MHHGNATYETYVRTHGEQLSPSEEISSLVTRGRTYGGFIDWPVDDPIPYELTGNQ
jgi:hypothetical protein